MLHVCGVGCFPTVNYKILMQQIDRVMEHHHPDRVSSSVMLQPKSGFSYGRESRTISSYPRGLVLVATWHRSDTTAAIPLRFCSDNASGILVTARRVLPPNLTLGLPTAILGHIARELGAEMLAGHHHHFHETPTFDLARISQVVQPQLPAGRHGQQEAQLRRGGACQGVRPFLLPATRQNQTKSSMGSF